MIRLSVKATWHALLSELLVEVKRLRLALDAAPSKDARPLSHCFVANEANGNPELLLRGDKDSANLPLFGAARDDSVHVEVCGRADSLLGTIADCLDALSTVVSDDDDGRLVCGNDVAALEEARKKMANAVLPDVGRLAGDFGAGSLVGRLTGVAGRLEASLDTSFASDMEVDETSRSPETSVVSHVANALKEVMLAVQECYKKLPDNSAEASVEEEEAEAVSKDPDSEDGRSTDFEDGVLTKRLGEELKAFEDGLRMGRVVDAVGQLISAVKAAGDAGFGFAVFSELRLVSVAMKSEDGLFDFREYCQNFQSSRLL